MSCSDFISTDQYGCPASCALREARNVTEYRKLAYDTAMHFLSCSAVREISCYQ
jgi:hypothetical protein